MNSPNPFDITKAVDFTHAEIADLWVPWPPGDRSVLNDVDATIAHPQSRLPVFLTGGKGGGRTHLLRYFSFSLQRIRHQGDLLQGVHEEGYIGIYCLCSGLNSSRFARKGQDEAVWSRLFAYYMDIWLGRLVLTLVSDLYGHGEAGECDNELAAFARGVASLFDKPLVADGDASIGGLIDGLGSRQKDLDFAVNNAAVNTPLDFEMITSPGDLVLGIPEMAAEHLAACRGVMFTYLIDEYENFTEEQQRYVNTLIRERRNPTTFRIGSREYGIRTHRTLNADEENKHGSEYSTVVLEDIYRESGSLYKRFCADMVARRLRSFSDAEVCRELRSGFLERGESIEIRARKHTSDRCGGGPRPWLARLADQLGDFAHASDAEAIVECVQVPDSPLHEKFAVFQLYRGWAKGRHLLETAQKNRGRTRLLADGTAPERVRVSYEHFRHDLYAQLLNDLGRRPEYSGFEEFLRMSGYLPRNLLVTLKMMAQWAIYLGCEPFTSGGITYRSAEEGSARGERVVPQRREGTRYHRRSDRAGGDATGRTVSGHAVLR